MTNSNSATDIVKNLKEIAYDMSILIVEDDLILQEQLKMFLSRFFKKTDVACDGIEALMLYHQNQYSLIFTDLTMPNMGGKELVEKIKSINESQHIMVLSAHSESEKLIELVNLGIDGYSLKPLNSILVLKQVNKICQIIYNQNMLEHLNSMLEESNNELSAKNAELKATLKELTDAKNALEKLNTDVPKEPMQPVKAAPQAKQEHIVIQTKKMSAIEFLDAYPLEIESTNESLEELEADFYILLNAAEKTFDHSAVVALTDILRSFAREIEMIPQFGAVANGIIEVEKAFRSAQDHSKIPMVLPMLGSLFDNLEKWRKGIFLYHNAEDIHYMDNSLISDALSLQAFLNSSDSSADTELELF